MGKDRRELVRRQWGYLINTYARMKFSKLYFRKQKTTRADKDVEKKKPLFIAGRHVK